MLALRARQAVTTVAVRRGSATAAARRTYARRSAFDDREDALEKRAVAEHDAKLLAELRRKMAADGRAAEAEHVVVPSFKRVTVVGAGLMGSGIAQVAAAADYDVQLVDNDRAALDAALASISKNVARVAKRSGGDEAAAVRKVTSRVHATGDLAAACAGADLVVEAVVENLPTKQQLFVDIAEAAPASCVLATNTSSLSVFDIMRYVADRSRVGGLHWFNPVPVMRLVEVVSIDETSPETHAALAAFGAGVGKRVIECRDTPGFVVNRLLVPYLGEAVRLVARGHASVVDTDEAMKLGAGHPMGPLTLLDYVGLDTTMFILEGWSSTAPDNELFAVPRLLRELVEHGYLGNKNKGGFYVDGKPNPAFFDDKGFVINVEA